MKAERQQRERTSRVIQPSKGGGGHIVDNRPQTVSQVKTIDCIQSKQSTISLPIQRVRLSTNEILHNALEPGFGSVAHHIIPDSFVVGAINENQLDLDEYEQFYDNDSNGIVLSNGNHNNLHHHHDYDTMVNDAVGDVDLSDLSDENEQNITDIADDLRGQIEDLYPDPEDSDSDYVPEDE